jgi:2-methylcitrate dehydratase PrpD
VRVTERLARFAIELTLADLPESVRRAARLRILDTLAVTVAGADEACTRMALDVAGELGGTPVATIVGHKERTSPAWAAFVNGVGAHALEYDDITSSAITHTSAAVVPAALALGEARGITGGQFLAAYIAGFEVATRIGWGVVQHLLPQGWHPNGVLGAIGCAVAGAHLLRLDLNGMRAAMGMGASCASGIRKNVGSMTKPFHVGHAAKDGVLAALLAARGFTADPNVLESEAGPFDLGSTAASTGHSHYSFPEAFVGAGRYDLAAMVRGLGEVYELGTDSTVTRFHPGSTFPQPAIDEVLALATRHGIRASEVKRVEVGVTPKCLSIAPYGRPTDGLNARFSVAYSVAVALLDGRAGVAQYTDERVRAADIKSFLDRVRVFVPDEFAGATGGWGESVVTPVSARVIIHLNDGRAVRGERHTTRGYPGWPATWDDVVAKYEECAQPLQSKATQRRVVEMVAELEELPDIRLLATELGVRVDGPAPRAV